MFSVILLFIFFGSVAMTVREGLWSNTLTLINVLFCGLAAYGFYPPLVTWIDEMLSGKYTYVIDFAVVWALFILFMIICRALTGMASKTRLRFRHPIDPIGGPLVGFLTAIVLSGFTTSTLFMAPMPSDAFGSRIVTASELLDNPPTSGYERGQMAGRFPDLAWLGFVEQMSSYSGLGPARSGGSGGRTAFTRKAFIAAYLTHRQKFEKATTSWLGVGR
jgi:uncharacterized membrane protein required for colicin V production